ncbi:toxic anion resistance protein [Gammaproteobacteria bacterium]|nr:toxic anion resistance protein [Gammaproteobacteria bacterium]
MQTTTQTTSMVDEITAKTLPTINEELIPYQQAQESEKAVAMEKLKELDLSDSNSILFFGSKAQQQLTQISDSMLEGVRNKDVGPASDSLNEMVAALRGFGIENFDASKKPGFFARLFGRVKPLVKIIQRYEGVRQQIDLITDRLEEHKTRLLTDVASLDRLYDANLDYFAELETYIHAGEAKLIELDETIIPAFAAKVSEGESTVEAQELRDLRSVRDELDRRVHDLRLTRQVTMQSLPSIRLVQENDKGLIQKIQSTLVNTVPLWRQQLATAVTIYRSQEAGRTLKEATDLTNDLLESNAENLKIANTEIRQQIERGVVDVESLKKANSDLIDTIEDSLKIADKGREDRNKAVGELQQMENRLRETLASASARAQDIGGQS